MAPPPTKSQFEYQWSLLVFVIAGLFIGELAANQLITGSTQGPIPAPGTDGEKTSTFLVAGLPVLESTGPWSTEPDRFRRFHRYASIPFKVVGAMLGQAVWSVFSRRREKKQELSQDREDQPLSSQPPVHR